MTQLNKSIKQEFLKALGENIKRIRIEQTLTQQELALKINSDISKISRIERGLYNFGILSVLILAQALNTELNELLNINNIGYFRKHILEKLY